MHNPGGGKAGAEGWESACPWKTLWKKTVKRLVISEIVHSFALGNFYFIFYHMNLYIANLNYRVRENELEQVLSEYGTVSEIRIIKDRETGRSRGFAFVEMDERGAALAIQNLNGKELMGRQMVVKEAQPRQ